MPTHLAMFLACLALDWTAVRWVNNIAAHERWRAVAFSGLCTLVGQFTTLFWIANPWLLISSCLGHMVGTALAIRNK